MILTHSQTEVLFKTIDKFDAAGIRYAVWSGTQAALLAGHRLTNDVDIWVHDDDIVHAVSLFPEGTLCNDYDSVAMTLGDNGEVDLMGRMNIHTPSGAYQLRMSQLAAGHRVAYRISGRRVMFANPADTLLLKAILQRGPEVGKHDFADIAALCRSVRIDVTYLLSRVKESGSMQHVRGILTNHLPHFGYAGAGLPALQSVV